MARGSTPLIVILSAVAAVSWSQDRPTTVPSGSAAGTSAPTPAASKPDAAKTGDSTRNDRPFPGGGVDADKAREAFKNMSPDERERWLRRFRDWADMPAERKKSLADREEFFRRKMREDVEAAQKEIGLDLTEEQKKAFAQRYIEERRKIEEDLRRQMEESRRPKVKALVEKLRQEFAAQPVKTP